MRTISDSIKDLLVAQGIANGLAGRPRLRGIKAPALSTMASSGGVKAGTEGGLYRPIGPHAGGGKQDQLGNSGKGRAVNAPAKFTGLRLVSSRCLDTANPTREPRAAVSKHLMLVVSN